MAENEQRNKFGDLITDKNTSPKPEKPVPDKNVKRDVKESQK